MAGIPTPTFHSKINASNSFLTSVQEAAENNRSTPKEGSDFDNNYSTGQEPWSSVYWFQPAIEPFRWNKLFPYKLMVVRATENSKGEVSYSEDLKWQVTLPIPPESISKDMIFAIETLATLGGVHSDHNGVVFKEINISGSTGVLPLKGSSEQKSFNLANSIFAGTIAAAQRTANSALSIANGGISPKRDSLVDQSIFLSKVTEQTSDIAKTSGYVQFHLLEHFLENYATFKKTKDGRPYRLAFGMYKDNQIYLVEPQRFHLGKTANSSYEYPYSLSLKAYARISLSAVATAAEEYRPSVLNPNAVGVMLSTIQKGRATLYNAIDTFRAVGSDIDQALFEPARQMTVFLKEMMGAPLTVADLPTTLIKGLKDTIVAYVGTAQYGKQMMNQYGKPEAFNEMLNDIAEINTIATKTKFTQPVEEGRGGSVHIGAPSTRERASAQFSSWEMSKNSDKFNTIFDDRARAHSLFDAISPNELNLPPASIRAINTEREKIRRLSRKDFEDIRDGFERFLTQYEFSVGGGSQTVSDVYGLNLTNSSNTPNDEQFEVIYTVNRMAQEASKLAATRFTNRINISPVEYVAGLATRAGLAFKVPVSKFAVPFPYGASLEDLARTYLGDPDRYMEIAQLNGLRSPYVDEEGFALSLLQDGNQNEVLVAKSSNLYLGQIVHLISNAARDKREITGIREFDGQMLLTLSGTNDMESFKVGNQAYLQAYLPGTVNSQMSIYIPSQAPVDDDVYQTKDIPELEDRVNELTAGGVDLLLTQDNDLVITPEGDSKLAIGLANIIQQVRVMLSCPRGTLNQHPEYGLGDIVGQSIADNDAQTIVTAIRDMFSRTPWDARNITVNIGDSAASIGFELFVPGMTQNIPVYFALPMAP